MNKNKSIEFLTRKIAKIIYNTVKCDLEDRAVSDWLAAENIVKENFGWFIDRMTGKDRYEFKGGLSWALPDNCTYEDFENLLGNYVWVNARAYRSNLPRPPYGMITFS
jgi:hypothetical protein